MSLNISQTTGPIWTKFGRNIPWEFLFKNCSENLIPSKTLVAMVMKCNFLSNSLKIFSSGTDLEIISRECSLGDPFKKVLLYTDMKKFLKSLFLWKCWSDFEIISQNCILSDPFQRLLAKFWSVNKHGSGERGLFGLYGHEEFLKKSSSKPLVRFWNYFTEMCLEWPCTKCVSAILIHH